MKLSRWFIGIMLGTTLLFGKAIASIGCDGINAGSFNRTNYTPPGSGVLNTQSGFDVGDTINFTVSGLTGSSFELRNGDLSTVLLIQPLSNIPSSLSYKVTGNNSDTTLNSYMLVQAIPFEISVTATCVPAPTSFQSQVAAEKQVSKSFLMNRINLLLLNQPSGTSLRERSPKIGTGSSIFDLSFSGDLDAGDRSPYKFGIDRDTTMQGNNRLSNFRSNSGRSLGTNAPLHFRQTLSDTMRNLNPVRFDAWGEAYYTDFANDLVSLDYDGHGFVGYLGADYRISNSLLIGALVQLDSTKQTSDGTYTQVYGNGWMSGPYLSVRLSKNMFIDLRAEAGLSSSNALQVGSVTGNFDTTRWLVIGRLSGDWHHGPWRLTPMTDLVYIEENQSGFTDSQGSIVTGQDVALGRFAFGPEIGYSTLVGRSIVKPYGSIKGIWNFDRSSDLLIDGQLIGSDSFLGPIGNVFGAFWGQVGAGVGMLMPTGTSVRIGMVYDGIGDTHYRSLTALGQLSIPLG